MIYDLWLKVSRRLHDHDVFMSLIICESIFECVRCLTQEYALFIAGPIYLPPDVLFRNGTVTPLSGSRDARRQDERQLIASSGKIRKFATGRLYQDVLAAPTPMVWTPREPGEVLRINVGGSVLCAQMLDADDVDDARAILVRLVRYLVHMTQSCHC